MKRLSLLLGLLLLLGCLTGCGTQQQDPGMTEPPASGAEVEAIFRLPGGEVLAFVRGESLTADSSMVRVLFYNWQTDTFDEVFTNGEKTVMDPAPYVREDGVVRVRFLSENLYEYAPVLRAVMEGGSENAEG